MDPETSPDSAPVPASLLEAFHRDRAHLRSVAFRMLGSLSEAEDALQEAWLRVSRADLAQVENLGGYMTSVVARVCLDLLRSRKARREESLEQSEPPTLRAVADTDPEDEAIMADAVGLALLVVLQTLAPAERLAFVLHEMFGMPFDAIAPIVGKSEAAARQLASRARRRVRGGPREPDLSRQREVVEAYLAALRKGDLAALLTVLDPEVVIRADRAALPPHLPSEVRGAHPAANQAMQLARGAKFARVAMVDGQVGLIVAPRGKLYVVLSLTLSEGKISAIDVIADGARLQALELRVLDHVGV